MAHQDSYYRQNEAYAEHLANWNPALYAKYADALKPQGVSGKSLSRSSRGPQFAERTSPAGQQISGGLGKPNEAQTSLSQPSTNDSQTANQSLLTSAATVLSARVLDVGCGVGQVVARLTEAGFEAHGVDVSAPNIERARKISERCQLYDGRKLPFPDQHFASAGALNVLEHVDEPESFITELVRVVEVGGRIVLSSPNFFRVFGFRDYHPRMRGLGNKWRNWKRLREKRRQIRAAPGEVRFDRMPPIVKEPFTPDDDAIVATNALEMEFFLTRAGCNVESLSCCDRYVAGPVDFLLNLGPWRYCMFNSFLVARRMK